MLDTLRFKINNISEELRDSLRNTSLEFKVTDHADINPLNQKPKIIKHTLKSSLNIGSYSRDLNLILNKDGCMYLEFSVPKLLMGHNVDLIATTNLYQLINQLKTYFETIYKAQFPPLNEWTIQRIDMCYAWKFKSKEAMYRVLNALKTRIHPDKPKSVYESSVYFASAYSTIKFYDKHAEYIRHDYKELKYKNPELAEKLYQESENILRFEVEYRKEALIDKFGTNIIRRQDGSIKTTCELLDIIPIEKYYKELIYNLNKLIKINSTTMFKKDVFHKLKDKYSDQQARNLYNFYLCYVSNDAADQEVIQNYPKTTYYRYIQQLKDASVPLLITDITDPDPFTFDIPSKMGLPLREFDHLPLGNDRTQQKLF